MPGLQSVVPLGSLFDFQPIFGPSKQLLIFARNLGELIKGLAVPDL